MQVPECIPNSVQCTCISWCYWQVELRLKLLCSVEADDLVHPAARISVLHKAPPRFPLTISFCSCTCRPPLSVLGYGKMTPTSKVPPAPSGGGGGRVHEKHLPLSWAALTDPPSVFWTVEPFRMWSMEIFVAVKVRCFPSSLATTQGYETGHQNLWGFFFCTVSSSACNAGAGNLVHGEPLWVRVLGMASQSASNKLASNSSPGDPLLLADWEPIPRSRTHPCCNGFIEEIQAVTSLADVESSGPEYTNPDQGH